jgi:dTDP-glucose pyrophosphorylase
MKPTLLVLAAGMGSRYGGVKQIDAVGKNGECLLDFSTFDARRSGFGKVVFIIRKDIEKDFRERLFDRVARNFDAEYVFQTPTALLTEEEQKTAAKADRKKPWGTIHAVLCAKDKINEPFAVINADDYYGKEGFVKIYDFLTTKADASHNCMVGFEVEKTLSENGTVSRGICKAKDGKLADIVEHLKIAKEADGTITDTLADGSREIIPSDAPVSMNLWGFGLEYMDVLKAGFVRALDRIMTENPMKGEYYIQTPINRQIAEGTATYEVLTSSDKWFGVTYKEDKPEVVAKFASLKADGFYPVNLWG